MHNVDIIQLKTIWCNIDIGFRLPLVFNSWSLSQGSHLPPHYHWSHDHIQNTTLEESVITLSPSLLIKSNLFYNFWLHTVFLNNMYRCDNWLNLCTECVLRLACWLSVSGMKHSYVENAVNITMFHNIYVQWSLLDRYRLSVLCLV